MLSTATILTPSPVAAAFSGIQWDPLGKFNLTNAEKSILRSGEDNPVDYTLSNVEDACMYARTLLKVLSESSGPSGPSIKVSKLKAALPVDDALQMLYTDPTGVITHYAMTRLFEIISALREKKDSSAVTIVSTFYENGKLLDEWRPLLRILHLGGNGDPFAQRGASLCLAYILLVGCPSVAGGSNHVDYSSVEEPLQALLSWISSQLQSSLGSSVSLVTPTLTTLVNCREARYMFASSGGIGYIARHLRNKASVPSDTSKTSRKKNIGATVQQLYELCFTIWAISYECNSSYSIRSSFSRDGAVKSLCVLVKTAPREKVIRVALSALRNLAECKSDGSDQSGKKEIDGTTFLNDMISCGLMKQIELMKDRNWSDDDIKEDVAALSKLLQINYKEMSRWDLYVNEVVSGNLEWGVMHTEKFFQQNCMHFEGEKGDFSLLKRLIILVGGDDDDVASVACFDIGEFVRHYPNGRMIAKQLGAKDAIMKHIGHENSELQRHALHSVSKIMVQNWGSLV